MSTRINHAFLEIVGAGMNRIQPGASVGAATRLREPGGDGGTQGTDQP